MVLVVCYCSVAEGNLSVIRLLKCEQIECLLFVSRKYPYSWFLTMSLLVLFGDSASSRRYSGVLYNTANILKYIMELV